MGNKKFLISLLVLMFLTINIGFSTTEPYNLIVKNVNGRSNVQIEIFNKDTEDFELLKEINEGDTYDTWLPKGTKVKLITETEFENSEYSFSHWYEEYKMKEYNNNEIVFKIEDYSDPVHKTSSFTPWYSHSSNNGDDNHLEDNNKDGDKHNTDNNKDGDKHDHDNEEDENNNDEEEEDDDYDESYDDANNGNMVVDGKNKEWKDLPFYEDLKKDADCQDIVRFNYYNSDEYLYLGYLEHNSSEKYINYFTTIEVGDEKYELKITTENKKRYIKTKLYNGNNELLYSFNYDNEGDPKFIEAKVPLNLLPIDQNGGYELKLKVRSDCDNLPDDGYIIISSISSGPYILIILIGLLFFYNNSEKFKGVKK